MKSVFIFFIFFSIFTYGISANELINTEAKENNEIKCAIATFINLHDEEDVLGAMSLARSLNFVDTKMKMIAIVYGDSKYYWKLSYLKEEGWTIFDAPRVFFDDERLEKFEKLDEDVKESVSHFFVYLLIQYDMIVYLEKDIIVTQNIDELCRCNKVSLGGTSYINKHNNGAMTLIPSVETFQTLSDAAEERILTSPYDVFEYLYQLQECPYFDPLLGDFENVPSEQCVRLPIRYNGDITYQMLSGWIDNKNDQPKILHYSISGMNPWSWWCSILLPQYWLWSFNYLEVLENAHMMFMFTKLIWFLEAVFILVVFYFFPSLKKFISRFFFGFLYNGNYSSIFSKLFIFHIVNLIAVLAAFHYSNIYMTHPFMNILLFAITITGFMDVILFNHVPHPYGLYTKIFYILNIILFFSLFLNSWMIPTGFLFRVVLVMLWFIVWHAIVFTAIIMFIYKTKNESSKKLRMPVTSSKSSNANPLVVFVESLSKPADILSDWLSNPTSSN